MLNNSLRIDFNPRKTYLSGCSYVSLQLNSNYLGLVLAALAFRTILNYFARLQDASNKGNTGRTSNAGFL